MNFLKKYFNILLLSSFLILLLISIIFFINENLYINRKSDILINKLKNNFDNYLYKSKINFLYTNIYNKNDKNGRNFIEFSKNTNKIINIFYSKIEYIEEYYKNNKELPILTENNIYFYPLNYMEVENINIINFDQIIKTNKLFSNNNDYILINYLFIKNIEKSFFILLSLPYDYDIKYSKNKRCYIIVLKAKNKIYSKSFSINN